MTKRIFLKIGLLFFIVYSCNSSFHGYYTKKTSVGYDSFVVSDSDRYIFILEHKPISPDTQSGYLVYKNDTLELISDDASSYLEEIDCDPNLCRIQIKDIDDDNEAKKYVHWVIVNREESCFFYECDKCECMEFEKPVNIIELRGIYTNQVFYTKDSLKSYIIHYEPNDNSFVFPSRLLKKGNKLYEIEDNDSIWPYPVLGKRTWYRRLYNKVFRPEVQLGY